MLSLSADILRGNARGHTQDRAAKVNPLIDERVARMKMCQRTEPVRIEARRL